MLMQDILRTNLSTLLIAFEEAAGVSAHAVAVGAFRDNKAIRRIMTRGFTVSTYDRAVSFIARHWPVGSNWPKDIPRPTADDIEHIEAAFDTSP